MKKILISCGEPSGDLYAGALAREIRSLDSTIEIFGLGGEQLQAASAELVADYHGLTVTGLSEALAVLPRSYSTYRKIVARAAADPPAVFVAVDFPDFNFRLAAAIRALGIPVVYYIGPQVWAWRRRRLQVLKRLVDQALVIFPFEAELYRDAGIPVEFVGHPLLELAIPTQTRHTFLEAHGLNPNVRTIALLPGSRPNEVKSIFPGLIDAARLIASRLPDVQFVVARAPHLNRDLFYPISDVPANSLVVVEGMTDDVLAASDVVLTASGTATVQAAIHQCPMVIVYRLSPVTYQIVKTFTHVENVGMVNLIARERIVPELIQRAFTPDAVADEAMKFLQDSAYAQQTRTALGHVRSKLGQVGASRRAAEAVLSVMDST